MWTGTMTSKGQITVPKDVREAMGLTPGTKVDFRLVDGQWVISTEPIRASDVAGRLSRYARGTPVTVEEMNEAIADAAAESGMRGLR